MVILISIDIIELFLKRSSYLLQWTAWPLLWILSSKKIMLLTMLINTKVKFITSSKS
jgi:hypothetical protein